MISRAAAPALTAVCGAALLLGACTAQPIPEPPPPPPPIEAPPHAPVPADHPDETGLLGGPPAPGAEQGAPSQATMTYRQGQGVVVSSLKTIPEPEPAAQPSPAPARVSPPPVVGQPYPRIAITPPAAPITARPSAVVAPPATTGASPVAQAPATPFVQTLPLATPTDGRLAAMQKALAKPTAEGARFTVPPLVAQGGPGQVSLRLPADLLAQIQAQARAVRLESAARSAEVSARLSGEGYRITPNETQTARLKSGEDLEFKWQVAPADQGQSAASPRGDLKAQADVALTGDGKAMTFELTRLENAPPAPAAPPVKGQTSAQWVLVTILVLLAALVLGGVFRNHAERRRLEAEQRKRDRAAAAFGRPVATPLAMQDAETSGAGAPETARSETT